MPLQNIGNILIRIADNQASDNSFFSSGLFQAYRYNTIWGYQRPDSNLFFTAISLFTLQRLRPFLTPGEQVTSDHIIARGLPAYARFRNKDHLATYNFYATNPTAHFPHGRFMHRFRHFQLPDDIDDTAMVYLTTQPSAEDLIFLSGKLAMHANRTRLTVQNTFPEYRDLRAYSTWFGLNMPIEFDACAMANMLYVVFEYDLPIDSHTQDSLTFLADIVWTKRYRTDPFRCAHNYARTPLIQYHLARLIGAFNPIPLRAVRPILIADLHADFKQSTSPMDKLLLAISLMRLGETPSGNVPVDGIEQEFASFSFFIAGLLSAYTQPWLYRWAHRPFWHIRWQCSDHCRVLLLEYLVLQRAQESQMTTASFH
ncbi:hypothetical protein [Fibrella forsythiae]|uniref:Uncharacterized protein n=1 Tax=Fibrella forsythiae TaxID=2817061 RepID=A0ABS3JBR3_9BACT|nr:hypothetical protein [Fibrella forsythiae]MBO0947421.1 hypothetical protein [Fibrella forsythiae]